MAVSPRSELEVSYNDFNMESTSVTFTGGSVADGNYVTTKALAADLGDAINSLTDGVQQRFAFVPSAVVQIPGSRSTSLHSMVEKYWKLWFVDNVNGRRFSHKIGTADTGDSTRCIAGTNKADLTHADWVAFKDAYEAFGGTNPKTGNLATFVDAELLGRAE